ncbi:MAG: DUF3336 domain-containing protein [Alphaproteobacteria bacterium]|nr:DUF3336 domain-containing protein [Alphaproteobacteria bacterium]
MLRDRAPAALRDALQQAETYPDWLEAAREVDRATGAAAWRDEDASPHYHHELIREQLDRMTRLREDGDTEALIALLHRGLNRNLGDLRSPALYRPALTGTKRLIERYLAETERTLEHLCDAALPGYPDAVKLALFQAAARVYGRSALMLSGGATLGFYHLGVVKALWSQGLLPTVISGASTGAMVAGGICARTEDENRTLFANPEAMRLDGLALAGPRRILQDRAALRPEQLAEVLEHNIGPYSFGEAHARSGRVLNVSVSPTRVRQRPRILNHLTAPDVLVVSAVVASSALPGLYPPSRLYARGPDGAAVPYIPSERWVDGSMAGDLPKARLGRLFNANHFIVSQTNPHVLPFLERRPNQPPLLRAIVALTLSAGVAWGLDVARHLVGERAARAWLDHAHSLATQTYRGDINITPAFPPDLLVRIVKNPTPHELARFIRHGERAVWPRLAMIRDQTRIGRCFERCVGRLEARLGYPTKSPGQTWGAPESS